MTLPYGCRPLFYDHEYVDMPGIPDDLWYDIMLITEYRILESHPYYQLKM